MERGGDLDQALQKGLFGLRFYEPYLFPKFVSFEEFLCVEMRQPLFEFLLSFRGFHREINRISIESSLRIRPWAFS